MLKRIDLVLFISFLLAIVSLLINHNLNTIYDSIDFKTIFLLFMFMLSLKALEISNFFTYLASKILNTFNTYLSITLALVNFTFFSSMLITNDVALIVLIPFSLILLKQIQINKILILSLQTIAANLGSSLSPFGNPQNIFIYTFYKLNFIDFFNIIFIYVFISFILINLIIFIAFKPININIKIHSIEYKKCFNYYIAFCICIFSVFSLINLYFSFVLVCLLVLVKNYKIIFMVDYSLLLTFIFLFIFVGVNNKFLINFLPFDNMVFNSIVISNLISNVPTTLLLHNFTDYKELLIGVNIGGLGTLISSMANLITFKLIKKHINRIEFLYIFTFMNILFLFVLVLFYII